MMKMTIADSQLLASSEFLSYGLSQSSNRRHNNANRSLYITKCSAHNTDPLQKDVDLVRVRIPYHALRSQEHKYNQVSIQGIHRYRIVGGNRHKVHIGYVKGEQM
jgi:hypothetical protein